MTGPSDDAAWAAARSLNDLCTLTERWLAGDLATQPGYFGSVDVDEEKAPGLTRACIALNRAGLMTRNSQAGFDSAGEAGAHWTQHAAVDGFSTPAAVLALRRALPARYKIHTDRWVDVTHRNGLFCTAFGGDIIDPGVLDGCSREAVLAVLAGVPFIVYDPTAGPNALWVEITRVCATASL